MAADLKKAILAAKLPESIISVPEWAGEDRKPARIGIRGLTVSQGLEIEAANTAAAFPKATKADETRPLVLSLKFSLFDPADGKLMFSEAEARKLFEQSQSVMVPILEVIAELAPTLKTAKENFTNPPASNSPTNSPSASGKRRRKYTK